MIPGQQALSSIDHAVAEEREKVRSVDRRIEETAERLLDQQGEQISDYRALAELRVEHYASGTVITSVDETGRQVLALLERRRAAAAALAGEMREAEAALDALERERRTQAEVLGRAAEAVDRAEAVTQTRLDADPAYQAQRERATEAERIALHAEDKASRSTHEKDEKGQSYRDDPLFMYLWNRRYGTHDYEASGLTRWLDGKVAGLIGYADARANYSRLLEIPERLADHALEVRKQAEEEFEALRKLDREAREQDGIPPLEARQEQEQDKLDAIDARIEEAETGYRELQLRDERFASGEDENYRKAVEYLTSELRRDDLLELRRDALATPFPEDDVIIARLLDRDQEKGDMEDSIKEMQQLLQQHRDRLGELESLRAEFKRKRYDRPGSGFSDGALVAMALANFLGGMMNRESLLRVLERQRRYRPRHSDITFGSGRFGRGTVWGGGLGGLGGLGGIGGLGRGGGGRGGPGGGGFRTGGGF